jgi:hypothetical protein
MRKLVPLLGVIALLLISNEFVSAQVFGFADPSKAYRVGISEEKLYLEADEQFEGRFSLMWSGWIVVETETAEPLKVVGSISMKPLGDWTKTSTNSFALGDPGSTRKTAHSGRKKQRPTIKTGINTLFLAIPVATIDLGPDLSRGAQMPAAESLFTYNQIVELSLELRRSGYWGGAPALAQKKFKMWPLGHALLKAAGRGDARSVKRLLDKGADVDSASVHKWTALMEAASQGHREVVRVLLDHGARVNARRQGFPFVLTPMGSVIPYGETALMAACSSGDPEIVRMLIDKGAKVNLERKDNWTALQAASYAGHTRIVSMLLAKGARVGVHSELGYSPCALADINGNGAIERMLRARGGVIRVPWDALSR